MKNVALILFFVLGILACETTDFHMADTDDFDQMSNTKLRLLMISSGTIGCAVKEIKIRDYMRIQYVTESWTASCKEQVFYCAYAHVTANCTRKLLDKAG